MDEYNKQVLRLVTLLTGACEQVRLGERTPPSKEEVEELLADEFENPEFFGELIDEIATYFVETARTADVQPFSAAEAEKKIRYIFFDIELRGLS